MRSTLVDKQRGSQNATYGSESAADLAENSTYMSQQNMMADTRQSMSRPMSARSTRSMASATGSIRTSLPTRSHDQNRITYAGDILEKRSHKFTEPLRPFTPRTNISNHKSRLSSSKCYNPPAKPKKVDSRSNYDGRDRARTPVKRDRGQRSSAGRHDLGDSLPTAQLSESMLMDMSLQSRDERQGMSDDVPRLDISMDTDHLNWLQEQASKAKIRARSGAKIPKSHMVGEQNGGDHRGDFSPITEEPSARSFNSTRLETMKK